MKARLLPILLACLLCATPAHAETSPLGAEEMLAWRDTLWAVLQGMPVENDPAATHDPDGADTWLFAFPIGQAELTEPALDADENPILSAEIQTAAVTCPRGLAVGDTLDDVLAAYPNENAGLMGDSEYAALYMAELPDGASGWGWVARQNRTVWAAVYTIARPAAGMDGFYEMYTLTYVIEDERVATIRAEGFGTLLTAEETLADSEAVRAFSALDSYTLPDEQAARAFAAADLRVAGLDFRTATPEDALALLGQPLSDTTDTMAGVRTLAYTGLLLEFAHVGDGWRAEAALVSEGAMAGPLDLRIGDTREAVTARFGAPEDDEDDRLMYTWVDEHGQTYALACTLSEGLVSEFLLYRL